MIGGCGNFEVPIQRDGLGVFYSRLALGKPRKRLITTSGQ